MASEKTNASVKLALRKTMKDFEKELRKNRREAIKAWAMTYGVLNKIEFSFASIEMTKGARTLLGNKLAQIGTVLALQAELLAIEKGKNSVDKKTMKIVLKELENEALIVCDK